MPILQDINTVQPAPDRTWEPDTVGVRVFVDHYDNGRDLFTEEDPLLGKRNIGLLDPADASAEIVPELESVEAGAVVNSLEELVIAYNGTGQIVIQDRNPLASDVAMGTTASKIREVEPTTPVVGVVAATGSDLTKIVLEPGVDPAPDPILEFVGEEGKTIQVPMSEGTIPTRAILRRVDPDTQTLYLKFALDEPPLVGGQVKVLDGFIQEYGGNTSKQRELIFALDYGKGASHRTVLWRVQSTGGKRLSMARGKHREQINFKIMGQARTVDGRLQQVPMSSKGTYGRVDVD